MFYSIIVPVYNRPDEIRDLLNCLCLQTYKNFEVCVVESGSTTPCKDVVLSYSDRLQVQYILAGNDGPGLSRNAGMRAAKGDFFIILDSDVLLDPNFIECVHEGVTTQKLDAYGGPDRCHPSFTDVEKAFNYTLTSFLTTGGMRGGKRRATKFFPRSFNMGISRKVFEVTGGYAFGFMGEDIDLSLRMYKAGFKIALLPKAYVYHHRKKDFTTFFRYMRFFGKSRVNITIVNPGSLKLVHLVPVFFIIFVLMSYLSIFLNFKLFLVLKSIFYGYLLLIFLDSSLKNKSAYIGLLSAMAVLVQMFGYGIGFLEDYWRRIILKDKKSIRNI